MVILTWRFRVKAKLTAEGHIGEMHEDDSTGIGPKPPVPPILLGIGGLRAADARRRARLGPRTPMGPASPCGDLDAGSPMKRYRGRSQTELALQSPDMR